jgi:hypothetical protein
VVVEVEQIRCVCMEVLGLVVQSAEVASTPHPTSFCVTGLSSLHVHRLHPTQQISWHLTFF